MKKVLCTLFALSSLFLKGNETFANNLNLSTLAVNGANITFKINWDNSWYASSAPSNWDAVWVFIKYKDCNTTNWLHASLSTNSNDHIASGGILQVDAVTDGKGVFIRRKAVGSGTISATDITLKLTAPATGTYNFRAFGIEMVNIPKGSFQIGDGTSTATFNSITVDSAAQAKGITSTVLGGNSTDVPVTFPVGYNEFYCMKYEITQQQYLDFLNTLSFTQQASRTAIAPNAGALNWVNGSNFYRNGLKIKTQGMASTTPAVYGLDYNGNSITDETTDGQYISYNYMSWADLTAYLDWACLRPMTDLEFEKICRGTDPRVSGEYVWGNITITQAAANPQGLCLSNGLTSATRGTVNEVFNISGTGLCACGNSGSCNNSNSTYAGPIRAGFAATSSTGRQTAGASFYGVLDMGGNLWERIIAVNTTGVTFTKVTGDGIIDTNGNANVTTWPDTTAAGSGLRGGSWYDGSGYVRTSDRTYSLTTNANRENIYGGRGVR